MRAVLARIYNIGGNRGDASGKKCWIYTLVQVRTHMEELLLDGYQNVEPW